MTAKLLLTSLVALLPLASATGAFAEETELAMTLLGGSRYLRW